MGECHSGLASFSARLKEPVAWGKTPVAIPEWTTLAENHSSEGELKVSVATLSGRTVVIEDLRPGDEFACLVTKVEDAFEVPVNCVQLCCGEQLFSEGCYGIKLADLGICEAASVMCVFKDPARERLLRKLRHGDGKAQYSAMRKLLELGFAQSEVHDVVSFLDRIICNAHWWKSGEAGRKELSMYNKTVRGLGALGADAAPSIPILKRHSKDAHVAQVVADSVAEMGHAGRKALSEMVLMSFSVPRIAALRAVEKRAAIMLEAEAAVEEASLSAERDVRDVAFGTLSAIRAARLHSAHKA